VQDSSTLLGHSEWAVPVAGDSVNVTAPAGAIVVDPAVDNDLATKTEASPPGTTFWLAPGTHTLGTDEFNQVVTKDGNRYIGAPGAILDGRRLNRYAFTSKALNVTISHLTVRGSSVVDLLHRLSGSPQRRARSLPRSEHSS